MNKRNFSRNLSEQRVIVITVQGIEKATAYSIALVLNTFLYDRWTAKRSRIFLFHK